MTYTPDCMPETPVREAVGMTVDLLSDVLTLVRLTGAIVFKVDITGPCGIAGDPRLEKFAPVLPPGTSEIVAVHVVLDGGCWFRSPTHDWFHVAPGGAAIFPHGGPHDICDQPGRKTAPFATLLGGRSLLDLRHVRIDTGPGTTVSLLSGFLGCDQRVFDPLCQSLPDAFVVDLGTRCDTLVRYAVTNALDDSPGAAGLRVCLAELLFLSAVRLYMHELPADATGWLAGLRDPLVRRALQVMHAQPARRWSVDELAAAVASSRSALAMRFCNVIGEPPMRYLTRFRMQLAARYLSEGKQSITRVADAVGYQSSAAFQRAFKRCWGDPPGTWRRAREDPLPGTRGDVTGRDWLS